MPLSFIRLYATSVLALIAIFTLHLVAIPTFADSSNTFQLGFLDSIDDPPRLRTTVEKLKPAASS